MMRMNVANARALSGASSGGKAKLEGYQQTEVREQE